MNNLGNAFAFPFKDPQWVSKFLMGALFLILSIVLVGIFALAGYYVQVTQRAMRGEEHPLPEWDDIGGKIVLGLKYAVVWIVYFLPIVLLYIPFFIIIVVSNLAGPNDMGAAFAGFSLVFVLIIVLLVVPYSLALTALTPVIAYRFAEHESIGEALDISALWSSFRVNWQNTLIVALIAVGLQSFAGIGILAFFVGIFFTIFYASLVSAYMHGALYRETISRTAPSTGVLP